MNRRQFSGGALLMGLIPAVPAGAALPSMQVWKTPTCGCCGAWVRHVEAAGFVATVTVQDDLAPIKARYGIPPQLESCHTATVAGYVIEGHVPAADIQRLLRQRPDGVLGLVVPGMPAGSPGMDGPVSQAYATLALKSGGRTAPFAFHGPGAAP